MKTISIHGIDEETEKIIRERAKSEGRSVNKIVKNMIADALGLGGKKKKNKAGEYADLCGVWTKGETDQFLKNIEGLETIDPEDWR